MGVLFLGAGLATPAAAEDLLVVTASASVVALDAPVTMTGTLDAVAPCAADRPVELEWRPADSSAFAVVAEGVTGADGSFTFRQTRRFTGAYRVVAPTADGCPAVVSAEVRVRVRARVETAVLADRLVAGACAEVAVLVRPPKPGQTVELQRRQDGRWHTIEHLALDADSAASSRPCFSWEDVGIVRLRARWPAQDVLNAASAGPVMAFRIEPAGWMTRIRDLIGDREVSISVGEAGDFLFGVAPSAPRTPASNQKLLLSMALLDAFGPGWRIRTIAAADGKPGPVLHGDLWVLGRGDPEVDRGTMRALARRIARAGIERVDGRVLGARTYFLRDWNAVGWNDAATSYVARPTALTFEGNRDRRGRNVPDPEARAAAALVRALERLGVAVTGRPGSGRPPAGLRTVASVAGRPLRAVLARMLRPSDNFAAEVLGKRLGVAAAGVPGTIAKGAAAISAWAMGHGVRVKSYDASGLSYANTVTAEGLVRLLWAAEAARWGTALFRALPSGGQGTLRHRLAAVRLRAKTGTLSGISALSGWVYLERLGVWGEFSILSAGMPKGTASELEDRIVRILQNHAR